jgi:hypothetical protein
MREEAVGDNWGIIAAAGFLASNAKLHSQLKLRIAGREWIDGHLL